MSKAMTKEQVLKELDNLIGRGRKYQTQVEAARAAGIHKNVVSEVLSGKRKWIPPKLLDLAGIEKQSEIVTTYRRKEK